MILAVDVVVESRCWDCCENGEDVGLAGGCSVVLKFASFFARRQRRLDYKGE